MQRLSFSLMQALVQSKQAGKEAKTFIVDVRGKDEVTDTGMIPTAVNIPLDQLENALKLATDAFQTTYSAAKPDKSDRIVTYCLKGMRAEKAAGIFVSQGYTHVDVFPGSWTEWSANTKQ